MKLTLRSRFQARLTASVRHQQCCVMCCHDDELGGDSTSNRQGMQVSVGGPVSMEELKHFFFSYAREDAEFVLKLAKELRAVGVKLWLDQLDIFGGQRWDYAVEGALKACQGMVAVLSPESLASNNVMDEVSYALDEGKLVVPVILRACDIPYRLRRVQHIDFTTGYDMGFAQLLRALRIDQPAQPLESDVPKVDEEPKTFRDGDASWCPELVEIRPGKFLMGSPPEEVGRRRDEGPQHEVTIRYRLAVSRYPVTFAEWDACTAAGGIDGRRPKDWDWGRGRRPVIDVTWYQARKYVAWLSKQTKKPYRLLSEAEWEYACRAETTTRYFYGNEITKDKANFGRTHGRTKKVGAYPPNAFGIYDMHGNVFEWVLDEWHDSTTAHSDGQPNIADNTPRRCVLRGGSWYDDPRSLRAAARYWRGPSEATNKIGFRVCRDV
jgi:formylglycine-generating enzyme required for sulfatase activity